MSTLAVHPHITVTLEGVPTPVQVTGGGVQLATSRAPYAAATVVLPLTADTALDALDPRDDTRVIINGSSTGHWVLPIGYGFGGYGHGPYGHTEGA